MKRLWPVAPTISALPILAQHAKGLGHTLAVPDEDRVVRRAPLYVSLGDRALPAFSLALTQAFLQIAPAQISIRDGKAIIFQDVKSGGGRVERVVIPIDRHGQMLVNEARPAAPPLFRTVSFAEMWNAMEEAEAEKLREWVGGKIVLISPSVPFARNSPMLLQANLLNTLLTGNWITEFPSAGRVLVTLLLAGLAAWFVVSVGGWKGMAGVGALLFGYVVIIILTLPLTGVILPVFVPLCAMLLAAGSATVWLHLTAGQRLRFLEGNMLVVQQELVAVREALVCQESNVEDLEEDLEAARAAVARSAGREQEVVQSAEALREQLANAKVEEESTRRRLQELDNELSGLRAVSRQSVRLRDAEMERLRHECEQMGIITCDSAVLGVFRDIKKGARSSLPVLILGEPGTGKELFARAVHTLSPRAGRPFVPVNMAAISWQLFESELFGHVRGSFTGAMVDRKGYFELADRGTIFLDEIGDLHLEHQGKLLRVLQEMTFYRVGATRPTSVDVRVVAATNKDLLRGVSEGWFREDLYFRLKGLVLRLPPLRERTRDVALLAEQLVRDAAAQMGREGLAFSAEALAALEAHRWTGNVRELQHCLEQAVALAESQVITKEALRLVLPDDGRDRVGSSATFGTDPASDQAVLQSLREHGFDMQATARALGWDRSTVTQRLKGMSFRALVESAGDQTKAAVALAGDPALVRTVELKLLEYYDHLVKTIEGFRTGEEAIAACKKRYKNLPDRHFRSLEILIRERFEQR